VVGTEGIYGLKTKKKTPQKERPKIPEGRWVFARILVEDGDTVEDVFKKLKSKVFERKLYPTFGHVPVKEKSIVIRLDLAKKNDLTTIKSASVCARYGILKNHGEKILNKDGTPSRGYVCAGAKSQGLAPSPKMIAILNRGPG
jgi:hypothetical protein